ncbi:uncharacterized protein si:ch211-269k10.4 [Syngnathus typhle]|uniref:uncharacterized protein si:ch211-269k10.4 n=1 Tax=Syngnathus typhle TaxID=161592 RepID=UPI002A6A7B70|nr:uncharacterized protein si:ch211-269k10.4 [Syngnathus typhle]XP_061144903.1 uncharacterized protein si:ch211-269k10.4 [Syngnathus typhle]
MACSHEKMEIQEIEQGLCEDVEKSPRMVRYQATKFEVDEIWTLHDLLRNRMEMLGFLQVVSGVPSVGIGLTLAVGLSINESLATLFRVSHMTGMLFIFAGIVSCMLERYPVLLSVSLIINSVCVIFALPGLGLIIADLTQWNHRKLDLMMAVELCILGLQLLVSIILCVWISKVKSGKNKPIC